MSTTKRSKKDSKNNSEPIGENHSNGHANGINANPSRHYAANDLAQKKLAAEQYYLDTCERYKVVPDAAIVVSTNLYTDL